MNIAMTKLQVTDIVSWDTYIVRACYTTDDTRFHYVNIRCIALNMEAAIAYVRDRGLPSNATILSCKVDPVGTMICCRI